MEPTLTQMIMVIVPSLTPSILKLPFKAYTYAFKPVEKQIFTNSSMEVASQATKCSIPTAWKLHQILTQQCYLKSRQKIRIISINRVHNKIDFFVMIPSRTLLQKIRSRIRSNIIKNNIK